MLRKLKLKKLLSPNLISKLKNPNYDIKEESQICSSKKVKPKIIISRINKNNIQKLRNKTVSMQFFFIKNVVPFNEIF